MRRAAADACVFVDGLDKEEYLADRRTQQAVTMSLLVVGESASRVVDSFPDFVATQSAVPWRAMRGMRNRIAHGYFEIDQEIVWDTVQTALPQLLNALAALVQNRPDE